MRPGIPFSSPLLAYVIDSEKTWEGEYPLARMVLGNPYYHLVYQDVLTGCSHGDNIYTVLDLEQNNYSVTNYHPVTNTLVRTVCLSVSICLSLCLSLPVCLRLSLSVSLLLCLTVCLSLSVFLYYFICSILEQLHRQNV